MRGLTYICNASWNEILYNARISEEMFRATNTYIIFDNGLF
jgi:hypothetical protein